MVRRPSRRQLLGGVGSVLTVGLTGCTDGSGGPDYEREAVELPAAAEPRTTAELSVATQQATTEPNDAVAPTSAVDLTDHAFVFESGYLGATVQGTVVNRAGSRIDSCEVRVRVYNGDDQLLGRYLDRVGGLDSGRSWRFTVIVLEAPGDIAYYDITALGTPG
ncbi:FxLYD domain-containing protein [Halohasta litorea]|uniref:FxLYD domain-containing protein n=1 Tax=Halohasta litorea TaxID=869891 RepID=A0ABD6DAY1_9EURY|nr:FxLYD domain-containing protein [Halohasta litorea]